MAPRMIAIYGKGGMGKSFFTSNLTARLTFDGFRVLQLGCDPKHDSCNTVFGGHSLPTLGDVWRRFKDEGKEDQLRIPDVIFRSQIGPDSVLYGCELGGPDVGRGCGGQGISSGFKTLEGLGLSKWDIDFVVMDFLGDVVCGGFATPLARSLAEQVIIVVGHDRQSLYAANNIAKAAHYFRSMGGTTSVLGLIVNRDDGSDTADQYAAAVGLPILARLPLDRRVRELADACRLALEVEQFDAVFGDLAGKIARREIAACDDYTPLEYRDFLRVFGAEEPEGAPNSASEQDLFGTKRVAAPIPLMSLTPTHQVRTSDPVLHKVQQLMDAIGIHITEMSRTDKEGITVTSGAIEMRLGADEDMDNKFAFLSALRRSGQPYSFVDLRFADAPSYS
ncbi:MAG: chlorophyllide a reductase iron protein subunit X [Roseiflexaceae bacterium]|nr:chlorophyllide a reductase iron protein subunit X [Roseiflexaceae bacterium]